MSQRWKKNQPAGKGRNKGGNTTTIAQCEPTVERQSPQSTYRDSFTYIKEDGHLHIKKIWLHVVVARKSALSFRTPRRVIVQGSK